MSEPSTVIWNLDNKQYPGSGDVVCRFYPENITQNDKQIIYSGTYDNGTYKSGFMDSKGKFSFQYGFIEIRCKVPQVPCVWANLYLADDVNDIWPRLGEIDILQVLGTLDNSLAVHAGSDPAHHVQNELRLAPSDWKSQYHTFAVDWQPSKVIWYVDNVEVFRSLIYVPQNPLYVYMTMVVDNVIHGQKYSANPDDFPVVFDIDYLKIWQRK